MARKKTPVLIDNYIDIETGELLHQNIIERTIKTKTKREFTMTFYAHEAVMMDISLAATRTLYWCGRNAASTTREVGLNKLAKSRISELSGFNIRTIENAITELVMRKMLVRVAHGVYMVNPETTFKGSIDEHATIIEVYNRYVMAE